MRYSAHTDRGPMRDHQEDAVVVDEELGLFVVLDGSGAHAPVHTEVLEVAQHVMPAALRRRRGQRGTLDGEDLKDALVEANDEMHRITATNELARGSGATAVALLACDDNDDAFIAWVGDCQAFHVGDTKLVAVNEPHTLAQVQLRAGLITPAQAAMNRFRNVITRSLGFAAGVEVDVITVPFPKGARLLLTSDGLFTAWTDVDDACAALHGVASAPLARAARELVDIACAEGASDNVSVIVVER